MTRDEILRLRCYEGAAQDFRRVFFSFRTPAEAPEAVIYVEGASHVPRLMDCGVLRHVRRVRFVRFGFALRLLMFCLCDRRLDPVCTFCRNVRRGQVGVHVLYKYIAVPSEEDVGTVPMELC